MERRGLEKEGRKGKGGYGREWPQKGWARSALPEMWLPHQGSLVGYVPVQKLGKQKTSRKKNKNKNITVAVAL